MDMYCAKNGNISYAKKVFGSEADPVDKCIFGALFSTIIIALLIGPFYFFSEYGGFTGENPVTSAQLEVSLVISKTVDVKDLSFSGPSTEYEHSNDL